MPSSDAAAILEQALGLRNLAARPGGGAGVRMPGASVPPNVAMPDVSMPDVQMPRVRVGAPPPAPSRARVRAQLPDDVETGDVLGRSQVGPDVTLNNPALQALLRRMGRS